MKIKSSAQKLTQPVVTVFKQSDFQNRGDAILPGSRKFIDHLPQLITRLVD